MIADSGINLLLAGHDQGDVAMLVADGCTYYCVSWLDRVSWTIRAAAYVEQPDGDRVSVFENVVYQLPEDDVLAGRILEAPKLIATGSSFLVHFIRQTGVAAGGARILVLDRFSMDMTSFSATTWSGHLTQSIYFFGLYDVQRVLGHPSDFLVVFCDSDDQITVNRHDGVDWGNLVWTTTIDGSVVTDFLLLARVLTVYGHDPDNDVIVLYQRDDGASIGHLHAIHLDADDGGGATDGVAMNQFPDGNYVLAGLDRVGGHRAAVVVEAQIDLVGTTPPDAPISFVHHVGDALLNTQTATRVGNQHGTPNATLHSRPWAFPNGTSASGTAFDVFAVIGFKSCTPTNDWTQSLLYVCNLDVALWQTQTGPGDTGDSPVWDTTDPPRTGIRVRPVSTIYTVGIPDTRPAGHSIAQNRSLHFRGPAREVNHISNAAGAPTFGPNCKTRTIAVGVWAQQQQTRTTLTGDDASELQPTNAGISMLLAHMEDPWALWREGPGRLQPVENFASPYSRAMCQSASAGRSLFLSGGTPYVYDGQAVAECSYVYAPEIFDGQSQNSPDYTGLSNGTYRCYVVWTRRDKAGQLHRSAPSNVHEFEIAGDENVHVLRLRSMSFSIFDSSAHSDLAGDIMIEVFRTTIAAPSTFYREYGAPRRSTPPSAPSFRAADTPINNANAAYIDVFVGVPDADVVNQGLGPYQFVPATTDWTGPVPAPPPAMTCTCAWLNRVWGADALDPAVLWYSDEIAPDYGSTYYQGPVFDGAMTIRLGEYGEVTGLQPMDAALIVFTARGFVLAVSVSPAGTSAEPGLLLANVEVLHEGLVCLNPRSIVLYPHGVGFQSSRGYYLLARSREAGYGTLARSRDQPQSTAGAAIEDDLREAGSIRAATLMESEHAIRLVANGRPVTTWTTVLSVTAAANGNFSITVADLAPIVYEGNATQTTGEIESGLAARIQAAIDDRTLVEWISSVSTVGVDVTLTWVEDVEPNYSTSAAPGSALIGTDDSTLETRPRILHYDYLVQQWSRFPMPQASANTRLAELVAGCTWRGALGQDLHVALAQGAVLIERPRTDSVPFGDETSTGVVGVPVRLRWSWVSLAGISGYDRTWEVIVQTQRLDQAPVFATLDYDRDGTFTGIAIPPTNYSWPRPGQTVTPADLRIKPMVQRARAFRPTLYESPLVSPTENLAVVGLAFHVGAQPAPARVANASRGDAT